MGKPTRLAGAAALLVLIVLLVAACGSGSNASSSSTTTTAAAAGTGGNGQGLASFQACLSKAGVKLPSGGAGGPGGGGGQPPADGQPPAGAGQGPPGGGGFGNLTAAQRKAISACSSKLPASARNGFGGGRPGGQSNPALAKYMACLRKHGVTFGSSNNQAAFKKASAACAKLAPTAAG